MSLAALIRTAVATADAVTGGLQVTVQHASYTSQDGYATPALAAAVPRQAVVLYAQKPVRTLEGHERLSTAQVIFPRPVAVDLRDTLTLPDGRTAPILATKGVADPATGQAYATEVWLG